MAIVAYCHMAISSFKLRFELAAVAFAAVMASASWRSVAGQGAAFSLGFPYELAREVARCVKQNRGESSRTLFAPRLPSVWRWLRPSRSTHAMALPTCPGLYGPKWGRGS
jgi:hypothetical protein